MAHTSPESLYNFYCLGDPKASERRTKSDVAHKWAVSLQNPYHLGGTEHFRGGDKGGGGTQ